MGDKGITAFGNITWWGFSPAVDLQETGVAELLKKLDIKKGPDTVNILLVGAGDLRHVLTTIARRNRHPKRKLHFYIIETALELYARHMLFLALALETQKRMGLQEKTELFLELYGNTLVRKQTSDYVEKMATEFIKMVTDFEYLEKQLPCLDLSHLKFKERDFLACIFKFWRDSAPDAFDAKKCWELRLRQYLGTRYDARFNVFDWDRSMCLCERGADIIHTQEYKGWRDSGVAFTVREGSYDVANKTLASGMVLWHDGERYARRGYWGDILVSPYVPIGIQSEERSFFKKSNGIHTTTSETVAEFNMLSVFHELAVGEKYCLPPNTDYPDPRDPQDDQATQDKDPATTPDSNRLQPVTEDAEESQEDDDKVTQSPDTQTDTQTPDVPPCESTQKPLDLHYESLPLEDVKVTFLPLGCAPELHKRSKFQGLFHVVYMANSLVHHLKPQISATFANRCTVLIESALLMVEVKKEQVKQYVEKVTGMAQAAGCQELEPCDCEQDTLIKTFYQAP